MGGLITVVEHGCLTTAASAQTLDEQTIEQADFDWLAEATVTGPNGATILSDAMDHASLIRMVNALRRVGLAHAPFIDQKHKEAKWPDAFMESPPMVVHVFLVQWIDNGHRDPSNRRRTTWLAADG